MPTSDRARRIALLTLLASSVFVALTAQAQTPPPGPSPRCTAAEHRQFDFWLGSWTVTANGKVAGSNRIELDLEGCSLFESWSGAGGSRGRSMSFYDRARRQWHQTWIDSSGGVLELDGHLVGGSMVLEGATPDPASGKIGHERISWTPDNDGSVRQLWEHREDGEEKWSVVFDGLYRRQP